MGKHKRELEGSVFRQDHLFFSSVFVKDSGVGTQLMERLFP